jgi:hypothetical protein
VINILIEERKATETKASTTETNTEIEETEEITEGEMTAEEITETEIIVIRATDTRIRTDIRIINIKIIEETNQALQNLKKNKNKRKKLNFPQTYLEP